jgi:polyhydroxybutyrate depolymerase
MRLKVILSIGLILVAAMLSLKSPAMACGPDTDCRIGDRIYRVRMPEGHDGVTRVGAIVFAHGYRGNVRGAVQGKGFIALGKRLGVAIIATKSAGPDWALPGAPSKASKRGIDELAYYDEVINDVSRRFPIDTSRMMATGFSAGGMMVWNLICERSQLFAGFAPIAGTFWEPMPMECAAPPASVVHIHGTSDKTVPLLGRPIANTHQGQVPTALEMYARHGGFSEPVSAIIDGLNCRNRSNVDGHILAFCTHPGGHSFSIRHVETAWRLLVKAGGL